MEVTYTLTPEDLWAFQQFHAHRRPLARFAKPFSLAVLGLAWLFFFWINVQQWLLWLRHFGSPSHAWHSYWAYQQLSLLASLFFTVFIVYLVWGIRFFFLRGQRGRQRARLPITMRLYADAAVVTAPGQDHCLNWPDIWEIVGNRDYLFFYTSPATAVVVPKHAFTDGAASAFEAAARVFKNDPHAAASSQASTDVWPPSPVRATAPPAPVMQYVPDPPGTTEIAYSLRRADAWRSASYTLLRRPLTILRAAVPLLFAAFFLAFAGHAGGAGYGLAFLGPLLVTLLLIANNIRVQCAAHHPARGSTRACTAKIRPDAFVDITPQSHTVLPWGDVGGMSLLWGDLYVRREDGLGHYFIPRTAFQTPSDARATLATMQRLRQQAQEKTGSKT